MKNKDLKKVYSDIFKKGYEKTYTSVYTSKVVSGEDLTEEIKQVIKIVDWKGKKVLDVGCGTGLFAYVVAKKGANVLGIDYIPEAIKVAKVNYQHPNLLYQVGNAENIKDKYDVIVSIGTLEHMNDPFKILKNFKKHLRPRGIIIITSPNWSNPRGYILQTLYRLFDAPITLADLHYFTPRTFEEWSKKLNLNLKWKTFDYDWAFGNKLISDFKKRIPNVLRDSKLPNNKKNINQFIKWIKTDVLPYNHTLKFSGALGIYVFSKKNE